MNSIKDKLFNFIRGHKIATFFLLIAVIIVIYLVITATKGKSTMNRYTIGAVEKGTLIISSSNSGQVSALHKVDIKPKVSSTVLSIAVKDGQHVRAGDVIAQLETTDAIKAINDAQINLQSAQLDLQKLQESSDALAITQAQNQYNQAVRDLDKLREPPDTLSVIQSQNQYNQAVRDLDKLREPPDTLSVIQAQNQYNQAQRDLDKLREPPDDTQLLQAKNAVAQAQRDLSAAKNNSDQQDLNNNQLLTSAYDDAYNDISNTFLHAPGMMKDLYSVQNYNAQDNLRAYSIVLGDSSSFVNNYVSNYDKALSIYNKTFTDFKNSSRSIGNDLLYKLLGNTLAMDIAISQDLENARSVMQETRKMLDAFVYPSSIGNISNVVDILTPLIQSDISTINQDISILKKAKDTIDNTNQNTPDNAQKVQDAIKAAEEKLKEKQNALQDLLAGPKNEDILTAEENVAAKKQNLQDLLAGPKDMDIAAAEENVAAKKQNLQDILAGAKQADIAAAEENIKEKAENLNKIKAGPDSIDVKNKQLTIQQRNDALADANTKLEDYAVTAPFAGIVATVSISQGDSVSPSSAVATIITDQLVADVALNEVDVPTVSIGNKADLTFDALSNITITGEVVEIDTIGTVAQGVVTYNAKILFDGKEQKIKPGMTVNAAIMTQSKENVLMVPNAAVKTQGDKHYVEVFDPSLLSSLGQSEILTTQLIPQRKMVEIGLVNDTQTEIISGLEEGEQLVVQTSAVTGSSTPQNSSSVRIPGLNNGGGGGARSASGTPGGGGNFTRGG